MSDPKSVIDENIAVYSSWAPAPVVIQLLFTLRAPI